MCNMPWRASVRTQSSSGPGSLKRSGVSEWLHGGLAHPRAAMLSRGESVVAQPGEIGIRATQVMERGHLCRSSRVG